MKTVLVGADPELFVKDAAGHNISSHGMVPGTKKKPYPVKLGAVQVDGTALEFNIRPAPTKEDFLNNIHAVMEQLRDMIPIDYTFDTSAVVKYEQSYFDSLPKYAKALGCEPDYDAYTGYQMRRPDATQTMRTAAGHVHIGWTKGKAPFSGKHFQSCRTLVRELDASLGLSSLIFDKEGQERRTLYGQPGAFRPKPYGCEYRVLSNAWLRNDALIGYVYDMTVAAVTRLEEGVFWCCRAVNEDTVQRIITEGDSDTAIRYLESFGLPLPPGYEDLAQKTVKPNRGPARRGFKYEGSLQEFESLVAATSPVQWVASTDGTDSSS